jgi:hypothetical protein
LIFNLRSFSFLLLLTETVLAAVDPAEAAVVATMDTLRRAVIGVRDLVKTILNFDVER